MTVIVCDYEIVPASLHVAAGQYAVAVAESLSFRKAAERCNVSQPSLSTQLAQLERALDVRPFERDRRRALITSAGREILVRVRLILLETDGLAQIARRAKAVHAATVVV